MKKLTSILALMVAIISQSSAQKSNNQASPDQVKSAFSQKFPDAGKVKWEMEGERNGKLNSK